MEFDESEEEEVRDGLSEFVIILNDFVTDTTRSFVTLENRVSSFQLMIVERFKGHPIIIGFFLILVGHYCSVFLDRVYEPKKVIAAPTVELKTIQPRKKKIVYDLQEAILPIGKKKAAE